MSEKSDKSSEDPKAASKKSSKRPKKPSRRSPKKSRSNRAESLIQKALQSHLEFQAEKRLLQEKDINLLESIIEEYLENFIILGYNYHGEPVQLVSATTQQQADSLGTSLHRFLIKNSIGGGPQPGMF